MLSALKALQHLLVKLTESLGEIFSSSGFSTVLMSLILVAGTMSYGQGQGQTVPNPPYPF